MKSLEGTNSTLKNVTFPSDHGTFIPLSFNDYHTTIQSKSICISSNYGGSPFFDDTASIETMVGTFPR
jgi:hypothetical protein